MFGNRLQCGAHHRVQHDRLADRLFEVVPLVAQLLDAAAVGIDFGCRLAAEAGVHGIEDGRQAFGRDAGLVDGDAVFVQRRRIARGRFRHGGDGRLEVDAEAARQIGGGRQRLVHLIRADVADLNEQRLHVVDQVVAVDRRLLELRRQVVHPGDDLRRRIALILQRDRHPLGRGLALGALDRRRQTRAINASDAPMMVCALMNHTRRSTSRDRSSRPHILTGVSFWLRRARLCRRAPLPSAAIGDHSVTALF